MALMEILVYDYHAQAGGQVRARPAYATGENTGNFYDVGPPRTLFSEASRLYHPLVEASRPYDLLTISSYEFEQLQTRKAFNQFL